MRRSLLFATDLKRGLGAGKYLPDSVIANIRKGMRKGGRVAFACWRDATINPSLTIAAQEVYKFVPRPAETPAPEAPGPFAFAREARVHDILGKAGFAMADVVRVRYLLTGKEHFDAIVPVLGKWFGEIRPAATLEVVGLLDEAMLIEVEVTAYKPA